MVERLLCKQLVEGSSPFLGFINFKRKRLIMACGGSGSKGGKGGMGGKGSKGGKGGKGK
jgi:hypothetical protein